jgi:hypothetical protein
MSLVIDGTEDRRYRLCRCRECDIIALCTPENDFWQLSADPKSAGLLCSTCFFDEVLEHGEPTP